MIKHCLKQLWQDEAGFIVSSELVLIATILVIGVIVGQSAVRDGVVQELADVAAAIGTVNQSYSFSAVTGHTSSTAGSIFIDQADFCEVANPQVTQGVAPECVFVNAPTTNVAGG